MSALLLRAEDVRLRYGATVALDGVDLELRRGEIHAVVGENGAGKSSLLRVLAGAERAQRGALQRAPGARVEWVPQEASLPPDLDAAEWIFLGRERRRRIGVLNRRGMRARAAAVLSALGCPADPRMRLGDITASQRKQVQLGRALEASPDALLLDEPTAVLGAAETARLLAIVRAAAARGAGVLYVSHRLQEVLGLADRVTVLRDGCRVATRAAAACALPQLVRDMVGRELAPAAPRRARHGEPVLTVSDLDAGHVRGVTLAVQAGEVVGIAGLVGSGRSAFLEAVAGQRRRRAGVVRSAAAPVLVPEDRQQKGLVPTLSLRENVLLPAPRFWLRPAAERRTAAEWIDRLRIRAPGCDAPVHSLSGGNQQKLLLARALRHHPRVLLLDEPTSGVDVGAKAEIHALIRGLADAGTAIVLASSELPELLALCDRIAVLRDGRCVAVVPAGGATEEHLAARMTGAA